MITKKQLIDELKRLITENPDFAYIAPSLRRCCYTSGKDCKGCLFGQALMNLGIDRAILKMADNNKDRAVGIKDLILSLSNELEKFSDEELDILTQIQRDQDFGNSWEKLIPLIDTFKV